MASLPLPPLLPASDARTRWLTEHHERLDSLERECRAALGQHDVIAANAIISGYVVLMAAQFQRFCRDLYSRCVSVLLAKVPDDLRAVLQLQCNAGRALDGRNANYSSVRADFERFGVKLTSAVEAVLPAAQVKIKSLSLFNDWRNYVAHDLETPADGGPLDLAAGVRWRELCDELVWALDAVMYNHLWALTGAAPW